jgi:Na+/phosphate symporter
MDAMSAANYQVLILAFFITGSLAAVAALSASPRVKRLAYQVLCGSFIGVIVSVVLLVWSAFRASK